MSSDNVTYFVWKSAMTCLSTDWVEERCLQYAASVSVSMIVQTLLDKLNTVTDTVKKKNFFFQQFCLDVERRMQQPWAAMCQCVSVISMIITSQTWDFWKLFTHLIICCVIIFQFVSTVPSGSGSLSQAFLKTHSLSAHILFILMCPLRFPAGYLSATYCIIRSHIMTFKLL